jgi:tetratricopeptide (TPR) repeat protein
MVVFGTQVTNIRWHQGRLREILPLIEQTAAAGSGLPGFRAVLAWAHAEAGDRDIAQCLLDEARRSRFALPYDIVWLTGTALWADTASRLGDSDAAELLYRRLSPWHDRVAYTGTSLRGAVAHYLGQLADALGRTDAAVVHFAEALVVNERLRAPFHISRTKLELGRLLLEREPERAQALLNDARDLARQYAYARIEHLAHEALPSGGS